MTGKDETPVLIVGGGPVGLALAADLGRRGIACTLVEQGDGTIYHPRANTINSRTMEFCRRWGIAEEVRQAGTPPDFPLDIVFCTGLTGYQLARVERPTYGGHRPLPTTPERSQRCNQLFFDPIMRKLAASFSNVRLRYRCRFESFAETADGVECMVHDLAGDRRETINARYLVACCGGRSPCRRRSASAGRASRCCPTTSMSFSRSKSCGRGTTRARRHFISSSTRTESGRA